MAAQFAYTPAARARAATSPRTRMDEAKLVAREHVAELEALLARVSEMAAEVAQGGEAYPAGVRDACQRLEGEVRTRAQTIGAILHHTAH